jgi:hypothetical protein
MGGRQGEKRDEMNEKGDYKDDEVMNFRAPPRTPGSGTAGTPGKATVGWTCGFPYMGWLLKHRAWQRLPHHLRQRVDRADEKTFDKGGPPDHPRFSAYYDKVERARLEAGPGQQWSERVKLMSGARRNGWEALTGAGGPVDRAQVRILSAAGSQRSSQTEQERAARAPARSWRTATSAATSVRRTPSTRTIFSGRSRSTMRRYGRAASSGASRPRAPGIASSSTRSWTGASSRGASPAAS